MKRLFVSILGFITIFFSSCSLLQSTELYEEEIRDCVKFHLAKAKYISSNPLQLLLFAINDQAFGERGKHISEIYNNFDSNFRETLARIAKDESLDYKNDARKICKLYDDKQIDLPDYELTYYSDTEISWTFTELYSEVEFILKIKTPDETQTSWSCYPIEESLNTLC